MPLQDCLTIMCISMATGLVSEGLAWLLIYRTDAYKRLRKATERVNDALEAKKKEVPTLSKVRQHKKTVARLDAELKENTRNLSMMKMKSMVFMTASMVAVFGILSSMYEGRVVAKLPFHPISFITGITHRSLMGDDMTDCSFLFLHIVCSLGLRSNLQKLLGVEPLKTSASQSMFAPPPEPSQ